MVEANTNAERVLAAFPNRRIAVVGDLVADRYLRGTIDRVSREAPVLIVKHDDTETYPGGAANAAANIASLGGSSLAVGIVGNDSSGEELTAELAALGVETRSILASSSFSTTTKTRVLAGRSTSSRQQVLRIDNEDRTGPSPQDRSALREKAVSAAAESDAIIVSDYGYGAVDPELYSAVLAIANDRSPTTAESRSSLILAIGWLSFAGRPPRPQILKRPKRSSAPASRMLLLTASGSSSLTVPCSSPAAAMECCSPRKAGR